MASAASTDAAAGKAGPDKRVKRSEWYTFNGDLMAQKYALADQIRPRNVGRPRKACECHTGDASDESGGKPILAPMVSDQIVAFALFRQTVRSPEGGRPPES